MSIGIVKSLCKGMDSYCEFEKSQIQQALNCDWGLYWGYVNLSNNNFKPVIIPPME